jgi:hypothetical protein
MIAAFMAGGFKLKSPFKVGATILADNDLRQ